MRSLSIPYLPAVEGSAREWGLAIGGGVLLSVTLVMLLKPSESDGGSAGTGVMVSTQPVETARQETFPTPSTAPSETPPATPSPALANISGLILRGVMGASGTGSAIIEFPGGRQANFPVGRDVLPGITLKAIEPQSALFSGPGGDVRLALPGAELSGLASRAPVGAKEISDPTRQTIQFRTGLQARKQADGRITGFIIRPGSDMPAFAKAGLKPGDIVIGVNGRAFASEAEVNKLANEISISSTTVFEYERNGKRSEARLESSQ